MNEYVKREKEDNGSINDDLINVYLDFLSKYELSKTQSCALEYIIDKIIESDIKIDVQIQLSVDLYLLVTRFLGDKMVKNIVVGDDINLISYVKYVIYKDIESQKGLKLDKVTKLFISDK